MAPIAVVCPHCQSESAVVKNGKSAEGKQRFLCGSEVCQGRTFILNSSYPGRLPAIKRQIVDMTLNESGEWQRFVNFTPISPSNPYLD
jgi:transposase-like protein